MPEALTHGSLFTGIAGFELGLGRAGIRTLWSSEIDKFCNRVLETRFPEVPNLGDVSNIKRPSRVDVLSFGSPCQDLSVAGRRQGFDGARSGLFFEACRVIDECEPTFAIWENVPGAFSSNSGRDFWAALDALVGLGCRSIAWRVFDSQYFRVPQQRRRVYLVADFGGDRAAEVLFDPEGCSGHPSPFSAAGQSLAGTLAAGAYRSGRPGGSHDTDLVVAPTLRSGPAPAGPGHGKVNGSDRGPFVVETAKAVLSREGKGITFRGSSMMGNYTIDADTYVIQGARPGVDTKGQNGDGVRQSDVAYTLDTLNTQAVAHASTIRRFTPLECCRLQAFPDGWTCLCLPLEAWAADPLWCSFNCKCPDGPQYRAIGNAVTTTVPEWIGYRIQEVLHG